MKLSMFNQWRDLTTWSGHTLQYQSSKKGETWSTYIRDKDSGKPITFGISRSSKEESQDRAAESIKRIGIDGVKSAIETGQMVRPHNHQVTQQPARDIQWRDGINHRHRAQERIVNQS